MNPKIIFEHSGGYQLSKILFSGIELGVFEFLHTHSLQCSEEISKACKIHHRCLFDFLDSLYCMGYLHREGEICSLTKTFYKNTELTETYLIAKSPFSVVGFMTFQNKRLYKFWDHLTEGVVTGNPQNELRSGKKDESFFDQIYKTKESGSQFLEGMEGVRKSFSIELSKQKQLFEGRKTIIDVGGALGTVLFAVAEANPNLTKCILYELPIVIEIAKERFIFNGGKIAERIQFLPGDFFKDEKFGDGDSDVIVMGGILHDWELSERKMLMKKVHSSLNSNGIFIVAESIIADDRSGMKALNGILGSLNMLIETTGGANFSLLEFKQWAEEIGFSKTETVEFGQGFYSVLVAHK